MTCSRGGWTDARGEDPNRRESLTDATNLHATPGPLRRARRTRRETENRTADSGGEQREPERDDEADDEDGEADADLRGGKLLHRRGDAPVVVTLVVAVVVVTRVVVVSVGVVVHT